MDSFLRRCQTDSDHYCNSETSNARAWNPGRVLCKHYGEEVKRPRRSHKSRAGTPSPRSNSNSSKKHNDGTENDNNSTVTASKPAAMFEASSAKGHGTRLASRTRQKGTQREESQRVATSKSPSAMCSSSIGKTARKRRSSRT